MAHCPHCETELGLEVSFDGSPCPACESPLDPERKISPLQRKAAKARGRAYRAASQDQASIAAPRAARPTAGGDEATSGAPETDPGPADEGSEETPPADGTENDLAAYPPRPASGDAAMPEAPEVDLSSEPDEPPTGDASGSAVAPHDATNVELDAAAMIAMIEGGKEDEHRLHGAPAAQPSAELEGRTDPSISVEVEPSAQTLDEALTEIELGAYTARRPMPPPPPPPPRPLSLAPPPPLPRKAGLGRPEHTAPEVFISHARTEATSTGLGFVRGVPTTMVGANDQLRVLTDAYKSVASERGLRVVTVSGPPGTGKTRLVLEMLERLRLSEYPFTLFSSFQTPGDDEVSGILERVLTNRLRLPPEETPEARKAVIERRAAELFAPAELEWNTHVLRAIYELPGPEAVLREVQALRTDRGALRRASHKLTTDLMRTAAGKGPIVIWIDDLGHDEDDGLIELCELILGLGGLPILLLLVASAPERLPIPRFQRARVPVEHVAVRPLDGQETRELIRDILRFVEALPSRLVDLLAEKAHGIPRALEQLIRLLIDQGVILTSETEWSVRQDRLDTIEALPDGVEEIERQRIQALTPEKHKVVQVAAMLGSPFALGDLVTLLRLEPMDFDEVPWFADARESWASSVMLELMGADILGLGPETDAGQLFEFKSATEQRYLLKEADPVLARTVHGTIGKLLEERGADPARVAMHYESAGLFKRAAVVWMKVAAISERAFYNHAALEVYKRCIELFGPEDGDDFLTACQAVGRLAVRVGEFETAEHAFRILLQTAYAFQDKARSIHAYRYLGRTLRALGRTAEACDALRRALELAEALGEERSVADCLAELARGMIEHGEPGVYAEALKHLERALEMRRKIGEAAPTAGTLDLLGMVLIGRGDHNRAMACFSESLNAHRAVDHWIGMGFSLCGLAMVAQKLGRTELSQRHFNEALDVGERTGDIEMRFIISVTGAELALARAEVDRAPTAVEQAVTMAEQFANESWIVQSLCLRATVRAAEGHVDEAYDDASTALEIARAGQSLERIAFSLQTLASVQGACIRVRNDRRLSLTHTRDLYLEALTIYEEMGNWHATASVLRAYGEFLYERGKTTEAERCLTRARKLDPLTQEAVS